MQQMHRSACMQARLELLRSTGCIKSGIGRQVLPAVPVFGVQHSPLYAAAAVSPNYTADVICWVINHSR